MTLVIKHIWNPATGIQDIDSENADDIKAMASAEMSGIKAVWQEQRDRLRGTPMLADFTEKLSREWAIETGIIEGLYDIDRGVTQTLIEQGFRAELLAHGTTNRPREFVLQLIRGNYSPLVRVWLSVVLVEDVYGLSVEGDVDGDVRVVAECVHGGEVA